MALVNETNMRTAPIAPLRTLVMTLACWVALSNSLAAVPGRQGSKQLPQCRRDPNSGREAAARAGVQSNMRDGLLNGLASGLASATCKTLLHPFDVVKTVEQASKAQIGMLQAMRQVRSEFGTMALFTRGLDVTLVGAVPSIAVYFGVYQFFKRLLTLHMGPAWKHTAVALSAALANSIAAFFRVPAELVKQRVQAGLHPNALNAVSSIYSQGGLGAFLELRAVIAQMMRDIPFAMVMLVTYEGMKASLIANNGHGQADGDEDMGRASPGGRVWDGAGREKEEGVCNRVECKDAVKKGAGQGRGRLATSSAMQGVVGMGVGAMSGALGAFLTCPLDVVKTRWMVDGKSYHGLWDVILSIWRHEGPAAFMKGALPRILNKIPSSSMFFLLYEVFRTLLGLRN